MTSAASVRLGIYCGNAIKFSYRGEIRVRALADERRDSVLVRIDVQDQGSGISPADQARRFEPFVQPNSSTTRQLAMNANAFVEDWERCLDAGMKDHIAKPMEPEQLYGALLCCLPPPARSRSPGSKRRLWDPGSLRFRRDQGVDPRDRLHYPTPSKQGPPVVPL